jgi:hypothetical protein
MNPIAPSPTPAESFLRPQYFFWPLIFTEACLLAFVVAQFPLVHRQNAQFISLRDQVRTRVGQAEQLQAQLQSLAGDLLQLADGDPQAKALATKYQIQRSSSPQ